MKKRLLLIFIFFLPVFFIVHSQTIKYSINCGSDTGLGTFIPDEYFVDGSTWSHEIFHSGYAADTTLIKNPAPVGVYTSLRYGTDFSYVFTELVPDAKYTIRLHFADDWGEAGLRVQDVVINGDTVLNDFDIYAAAGKMKAVTREMIVEADELGTITIEFLAVIDNALISAIELIEGETEINVYNTAEKPYLINCGADKYIGAFSHDALFTNGGGWSFTIFHPGFLAEITALKNPAPVDAYTTLRYGNPFSYNFPGLEADSAYTVRLHFADDWGEANLRVQDIVINEDTVLFDLDIFNAAGKMKAMIREFNTVADSEGNISLESSASIDNGLICAIEILKGHSEISYFNTYRKPYAINCGGDVFLGSFSPDAYFTGGGGWSHTIFHPGYLADTTALKNSAPVDAYTTLRYGNPFSYEFAGLEADSTYTVRIHFADDWGEENLRVQDISLNSDTLLRNFDIFAAAGKMKAVIREFNTVADPEGKITVESSASIDNGLISAIEIIKGESELNVFNTRENPYNINCGSEVHLGKYTHDALYINGNSWTHTIFHPGFLADTAGLKNPAPVDAYTTLRYGNPFIYEFPDLLPETKYIVRLHFADDWSESNKRVQDITINGTPALSDFDIYEAAGKMVGTISQFNTITGTDGIITLEFSASVDNALISAIEIIKGELDLTGIENKKPDTFRSIIYPNPLSTENLTVKVYQIAVNTRISVVDMSGRVIYEQKLPENTTEIKLKRQLFETGQYLLFIKNDTGISYHKLIVL